MIAVGVAGAIVATALPAWDVPDIYLLIAIVAGAIGVVVPDAGGALFCTAGVVVAWATGAARRGRTGRRRSPRCACSSSTSPPHWLRRCR